MRTLAVLLLVYGAASLVHFAHNAEFISDYPNLPAAWSRADVYVVWLTTTSLGIAGWVLMSHGYRFTGLLLLAVYAALGLDSLGHYVLASFSAHTFAMNATILAEVTAAGLVLIEVVRQIALARSSKGPERVCRPPPIARDTRRPPPSA